MFLDSLFNLIFPPLCLNCREIIENNAAICDGCLLKIALNQTLFCGKCGARLPDNKKVCHKDFSYLLGTAASYGDEILKNLIHGLKFQFVKSAARPLGQLLVQYTEKLGLPIGNFSVLPIPLSNRRLKERGFNQSELIANVFADHFQLPLETNCLARVKNTVPQSETRNLIERRENVKGCFSLVNDALIWNKNIILIDDVTTSGATLFEAATVLKNAGARKIIALAVARV